MSKKSCGKIKLTPVKPKEAIRRIEKNGWILKNQIGGDWFYSKIINGIEELVLIYCHPTKELGIPAVKHIIRRAKKNNEEWVSL